VSQADVFGPSATGAHQGPASPRPATSPGAQASQQPKIMRIHVASRPGQRQGSGPAGPAGPGYLNPLRGVSGLVPERIDEGVDFGGSGPVYALGDAVVTNASENSGWPGGGWITYQLTDGPAAGLMVYVAEDVTPAVTAGQHVSSSTVIANMFAGADGIETGWAQPTGVSAESELPEAGGIGASGPYPTRVGVDFDELLQALGVPAAPTPLEPAYGTLPANYPASW
jgi:murein DD-endopeptidase MepM/ murein hydrolase activator NlpD